MNAKIRKPVSGLVAVGLVLALISGCSGGMGSSKGEQSYIYTPGDETVELTFWTSTIDKVNADLVEKFNNSLGKEQNIHVTAEYQGDYWEMQKKINAAAIAKTLPNAFIDEVSMTRGFAENSIIESLQPYIQASDIHTEEFEIGDQGNMYYDDQRYAFPHMRSVPVMYVNKALANQLGLNPEGPSNFDELADYLQACKSATGEPGMYIYNYDFWVMEALLHSYGDVNVLNDDETATNINSPKAVELISYLDNLQERGLIKILGITDQDAFYGALTKPSTALVMTSIGGYVTLAGMATQAGGEIGVSMIPSGADGNRGVPVGGSNTFLSNTGSDREKAAAFVFLNWLAQAPQSAYASANTGYLPTTKAAYDQDILVQTTIAYPGFTTAFEEMGYSKMRPTVGSYHEIEDLLCSRINQIWLEDLPVQESLDDLADDVNEILQRQ